MLCLHKMLYCLEKHKTFVRSPVYLPKEIEEAVKTKGILICIFKEKKND